MSTKRFFPLAKLFFIVYYKSPGVRNTFLRKLSFSKGNLLSRLIKKLGYKKPKVGLHVHFQEKFTHSEKPKETFSGAGNAMIDLITYLKIPLARSKHGFGVYFMLCFTLQRTQRQNCILRCF